MPEVVAIGEILIDFVSAEPTSYIHVPSFLKCFGGAPMNTIVGVSRLGLTSGAIAAVGDDPFGQFLVKELEKNGVDASHVKVKKGTRTTITFVAIEPETGERSFIFYRKPWVKETSDSSLSAEDIDLNYIDDAKIIHVSGFALSQNPSRKAILTAVNHAKRSGVRISFDPTLRQDVWHSETTIRKMYNQMLKLSDIATFSLEEAKFLFQTENPERAAEAALSKGVEIVGIKLGSEGAFVKTKQGKKFFQPAFKVKTVDTTGAGDGWNAGFLVSLTKGLDLQSSATVANAVGALVVTKLGATTALPYREELNLFLSKHGVIIRI